MDKSIVVQGAFHKDSGPSSADLSQFYLLLSTGLNFISRMVAKLQLFSVVGGWGWNAFPLVFPGLT